MKKSPKHLTLLLPPPFQSDYQIASRSPTYFSISPSSAGTSPLYIQPISAKTSTPFSAAGTIIFDASSTYTPTSPAKPSIYASYLPYDEYSLIMMLKKERSEHFARLKAKYGVFLYCVLALVVVLAFWSWCGGATFLSGYSDASVFEMLFPGLLTPQGWKGRYTSPPSVFMTSNNTGYAISMPANEAAYPLPGEWYHNLCSAVEMKSMMAYETRTGENMVAHPGYYDMDKGYEGLETGGEDEEVEGGCEATLTFVVDDWEGKVGGVGEIVMGMWMAYGLARSEGREFFVVMGRRWIYGDINRYFNIPKPSSKCVPPPMSRRLPCPRNTAHKLITPATYKHAFGHAFENQFESPRLVGVDRQKPIFSLLRAGYEGIPLKDDIQSTITERVYDIGVTPGKNVVAVQVRRGDRAAREWRWHRAYLPLERFMKVSLNLPGDVIRGVMAASEGEGDKWPKAYSLPDYPAADKPLRVVASDDSDVFNEEEMKKCEEAGDNGKCVRAQDRKVAVGQPGGFWAEDLRKMEREERESVAVAYLVDFGVMTEAVKRAEDGWVVCGYYGDMCRMLAVGMGWESAIERGHWVNIDGDFDWFGIRW